MLSPNERGGRAGAFALVLPWDLHYTGGVNRVASDLYAQLARGPDYRPIVVVASWEKKRPTSGLDPDGRRTVWMRIRTPLGGAGVTLRTQLSYVLHLPGELRRFLRLVREHEIVVANFHYVGGLAFSWALLRWLRLYRGELVLSFHGSDLRDLAGHRGMARLLAAWMLRRADRLVVCSNDMARRLRTSFRVASQRVQIVYNGIDPDLIRDMLQSAPTATSAGDEKLIVTLGSYERVKGHDILLSAFARLLRKHADARLIIAGRDGSQLGSTRAAVQSAGLTGSVELKTDVSHEEALRLLSRARIFVLSSRSEGLPLSVLEAGVMGKAVVATEVGGIPEVIRDRGEGLLVPPEDVEALHAALSALISDPERAERLGRSLRQRVLAEFTLSHVVGSYLRATRAASETGV